MTTIKNLTPHAVSIIGADGSTLISFEPDSTIPAPRLKRAKADMIEVRVQGGVQVPISLARILCRSLRMAPGFLMLRRVRSSLSPVLWLLRPLRWGARTFLSRTFWFVMRGEHHWLQGSCDRGRLTHPKQTTSVLMCQN